MDDVNVEQTHVRVHRPVGRLHRKPRKLIRPDIRNAQHLRVGENVVIKRGVLFEHRFHFIFFRQADIVAEAHDAAERLGVLARTAAIERGNRHRARREYSHDEPRPNGKYVRGRKDAVNGCRNRRECE